MTPTTIKRDALNAAEIFDSWRVIPRTILLGYSWWLAHVTDKLIEWFIAQPSHEIAASTAVTGIISALAGIGTWVYKIYSDNGRDWNSSAHDQEAPGAHP